MTSTAPTTPLTRNTAVTYTLKITNQGAKNANSVALTNVLGSIADPVKITTDVGSCRTSSVAICRIGTLLPNQTATVTVTVKPHTKGTLMNMASVSMTQTDSAPINNSVTNEMVVQ